MSSNFALPCPLHAECYENRVEDKPFYCMSKCGAFQPEVCVFFSGNMYVRCQFSTSE